MTNRLHVEPGDEVALVSGAGEYWPRRVRQVFSSGKVAFQLDDGSQYTAEGLEVRKHGALSRVVPMTDEIRAHIQRRDNLTIVRGTDWRRLSNSQLARIVVILQEQTEG